MDTKIEEALAFCKKYLPQQGPLEYFVHHNTLHSFEEYTFFDALLKAKSLLGAKTSKTLFWYQLKFNEGRIRKEDIEYSIKTNMEEQQIEISGEQLSIHEIVYHLLFVSEKLDSYLSYNAIFQRVDASVIAKRKKLPYEYRSINHYLEYIQDNFREKVDERKNIEHFLAKFFAAYYDKGNAYWPLGQQDNGALAAFFNLYSHGFTTGWHRELKYILKNFNSINSNPKKIIRRVVDELNVDENIYVNYLFQTLYRLQGWSALILSMANKEIYNPTNINSSFDEFAAIMVMVDLAVYRFMKNRFDLQGFRFTTIEYQDDMSELILGQLFRFFKKKKVELKFNHENIEKIADLALKLDSVQLLKVWHEAYESTLISNASAVMSVVPKVTQRTPAKYQIVVCIDDREESLRRLLEESSSQIETFGYAGHFGLNIRYRGHTDIHFRPLCPVNASPDYFVWEDYQKTKRETTLAKIRFFFFHQSKSGIFAPIISLLSGIFAIVPLLFDVYWPRQSLILKRWLTKVLHGSTAKPQLNYESARRNTAHRGYTLDEMIDVVYALLVTTDINNHFGQYIVITGHGSESLNNPQSAAYDCGACGGGRGFPNARVFTMMANRTDVRSGLTGRGITIPESTLFIAAYHNTCNDDILLFDIPDSLEKNTDYIKLKKIFLEVQKLDAKERLRKFENVGLKVSAKKAFKHAQGRAGTLAQPRPEYGHNTNAICVVGPRDKNKNIFWDRRAFLVSYNQEHDSSIEILSSLINSIVPVCAGINLEYYFSYVDREKFGAGVKQPYNVTALTGVLNGYKGDLRIGLPWQMVEIHEPVRIIIYIHSSIENFQKAYKSSKAAIPLVENEWVRIIIVTPENDFFLFSNMSFIKHEPLYYHANKLKQTSPEYIKGERKILNFALLEK